MSVQFLVDVSDQPNYPRHLVLPNVYNETMYTGSPCLYLIHNRGTKHKVYLKKVKKSPNYKLYSREWNKFVTHGRYLDVHTFHFIRAAPDEYLVTAYQIDGTECNGYVLSEFEHRQRRCLIVLENLEMSPIIPRGVFGGALNMPVRVFVANVLVHTVNHLDQNSPQFGGGYVLRGQGWHVLAYVEQFAVGERLVVTQLDNHSVSMVSFMENGLCKKFERVPHMKLNEEEPFFRSPIDTDERMQHDCAWLGHEMFHDDEDDVFYAPLLAYVTDQNRPTIPSKFIKKHHLRQYHNALLSYEEHTFYVDLDWVYHAENTNRKNHMNIKHRWRDVVRMCDFGDNKMVRFKLIGTCVDQSQTLDPSEPVMMPHFHMC